MKVHLERIGGARVCPVVALVKEGKILLGYRNYTPDKWKKISVWTCPGGRCDDGETLEMTLRREVEEETGISQFDIIAYLGDVPGAMEGDSVPIFVGTTSEEATLREPEKFSEWKWFSVDEFLEGGPDAFINEGARKLFIEFWADNASQFD